MTFTKHQTLKQRVTKKQLLLMVIFLSGCSIGSEKKATLSMNEEVNALLKLPPKELFDVTVKTPTP